MLEKLDGKKVEGGKLGKYFAQTVGGMVGSHFGPLGAIAGAELGGGIKGVQMSSKFKGKTGIPLKQSEDMQRAVSQSKLPRLGLPEPRSNVRSTISSGATIPLRDTTRLPDEAQAMSANQSYSSNNLGNLNTNQSTAIIPTRIGISKSITVPKGSSIDATRKIVNNHLESTLMAISDTPTFDMIQANPQAFYKQQIKDIAMGLKAENPKYARLANSISSIDATKIDSFETLANKIREKLNARTLMETITGKGLPNRQGGFIKNPLASVDDILIQEAKKHKSAEDFVKAQTDPLSEFNTGKGISDPYIARGTVKEVIKDIGGLKNVRRGLIDPNKLEVTENINTRSERYKIVLEEVKKGERTPIIVNEYGEIMDGHHRLKAYQEIGLKEVPVVAPKEFSIDTIDKSKLTEIWNKANKSVLPKAKK